MSYAEVTAYLRNHTTTCGRFNRSQLRPASSRFAWATWVTAVAVALSSCEKSPTTFGKPAIIRQANISADSLTIAGQVLEKDTQKPVAGAVITCLQDSSYQTYSKADGSFLLTIPLALQKGQLLIAHGYEYTTRRITISPSLVVALRNLALREELGQIELLPGESCLIPPLPPPPPPTISTIDFSASVAVEDQE